MKLRNKTLKSTVLLQAESQWSTWNIVEEWKTNLMSLAILFHFLCAQQVSVINITVFRSLRLCCWITTSVVLFSVLCVLELWCGWFWVVFVLQAEVQLCFSLKDTELSLLDRNLCQNHHTYQDSFYNSVRLAETLLNRKGEFVALWGLTRGIPPDLERETNHLRRGQSAFWRKGDVIVQAWKDKRLVWMRSTINYTTIVQ